MILINQFIFGRTQPKKKLEIVESLSTEDLLKVSKPTICRIVKEVGQSSLHSRTKRLTINYKRRAGNNWNSQIDELIYCRNKFYVDCYLQYENTDTSELETFDKFFSSGTYEGSITRDDRHGNPRTYYFTYTAEDKARVIKSILLEFIYRKYADKLNK